MNARTNEREIKIKGKERNTLFNVGNKKGERERGWGWEGEKKERHIDWTK